MRRASEQSIAWAAGVFEGEGCITIRRTHNVYLRVAMTDEDVVRRFHTVVGVGVVGIKKQTRRPSWKQAYEWRVSDKQAVSELLRLFKPWFGERRAAKAAEALEALKENPGARSSRTHCPKGHPLSGTNLGRSGRGGRYCIVCQRASARAWRLRKQEGLA